MTERQLPLASSIRAGVKPEAGNVSRGVCARRGIGLKQRYANGTDRPYRSEP
jgi:hypothetical protein